MVSMASGASMNDYVFEDERQLQQSDGVELSDGNMPLTVPHGTQLLHHQQCGLVRGSMPLTVPQNTTSSSRWTDGYELPTVSTDLHVRPLPHHQQCGIVRGLKPLTAPQYSSVPVRTTDNLELPDVSTPRPGSGSIGAVRSAAEGQASKDFWDDSENGEVRPEVAAGISRGYGPGTNDLESCQGDGEHYSSDVEPGGGKGNGGGARKSSSMK